jgi:S1-C subfamily serine protease
MTKTSGFNAIQLRHLVCCVGVAIGFGFVLAACGDTKYVQVLVTVTPEAPTASTTDAAKVMTSAPTVTVTPTQPPCDSSSAHTKIRPSVVRIQSLNGVGTGTVVGDGLILTNEHVVRGSRVVGITRQDGSISAGAVIRTSEEVDLALVSVPTLHLPTVKWQPESMLTPGQRLLGLGYALDLPGEPSLTTGTYSAIRHDDTTAYVQTDTPLNHGNSGGPLFTECGAVVGIVAFGAIDAPGLNFAIAASTAERILAGMLQGGFDATAPVFVDLEPSEVIVLFYTLLDQKLYADAYKLLSTGFLSGQTPAQFAAGYATTTGVYVEDVQPLGSAPPTFSVTVIAGDLIQGQQIIRRFAGTWELILEADAWKLHAGHFEVVP